MTSGSGQLDVLIPTKDRAGALAVTLAGLAGQQVTGFRVVVSDQSDGPAAAHQGTVRAVCRVLERRGCPVLLTEHRPAQGMAEHRAHLLSLARASYVLFLDDDVWLDPQALPTLLAAMHRLRCGFVGMAVQGLSYLDDVRPHEQVDYQEWPGRVSPERVRRGEPAWHRWRLHNAANLAHLADRLGLGRPGPSRTGPGHTAPGHTAPGHAGAGPAGTDTSGVPGSVPWRAYKVAWVGGCVLYDRGALERCGGFEFWRQLPPGPHAGEDVVAQLRVMERYGGAGVLPSLAYHQELPTTVPDRRVNCYDLVLADERDPTQVQAAARAE